MSGDDADFEAYLAARWPFLVRSLVLIGLAQPEAEDVVVAGMARCRTAWRGLQEVDDVDAHVYGIVLDGRPRVVVPPPAVRVDDPSDEEQLREQLQEQLARLSSEQRDAVVLRLVAGLDEVQVADVLDVPVDGVVARASTGLAAIDPPALRAEDVFRTVAGTIEVGASPYERVVDRARRQRRRRWRVAGVSVAAAAVVVGVVAWLTTGSEEPVEQDSTQVVPSQNPIDISWYDGRLHLSRVAVELPHVAVLAGVGERAAYIDTDGGVAVVAPDGSVESVGRATPASTILGSAQLSWAAWLEDGEAGTRIVVWSLGDGREVGSISVSPETRLVALDQDRVYARGDAGTFSWQPTGVGHEQAEPPRLVAVRSATRVYQRREQIEMVQSFFGVSYTRRGVGATVSPGGTFVLSRVPGPWVPGTPYTPLVYDTRTGDALPSGIDPDERVVDAAFGDNHQVDYLVANVRDLRGVDLDGARSRLYVLRTCQLETDVCSDVVPVRSAGERAMFAS